MNHNVESCNILGTNINIVSMEETEKYIQDNIEELKGQYICVSNVHTTVMAYDNAEYRKVQNTAALRLPDGKPLSMVAAKRGFENATRVTGPDLMGEIFKHFQDNNYRHFFYGSSEETLNILREKLEQNYAGINIAGMFSPPFRPLSKEEDAEYIQMINDTNPDIVWVGLGAPKQENWMYNHMGKVKGLMIGVGAGFDYYAGNIKRAPQWMQRLSLEWLYRLMQDPKRLFKRYFDTNIKFLKLIKAENKKIESGKKLK